MPQAHCKPVQGGPKAERRQPVGRGRPAAAGRIAASAGGPTMHGGLEWPADTVAVFFKKRASSHRPTVVL
eukprot:COSAG01_NODE_574_length_15291_cov_18.398368_11_plen_70_part_00